MTAEIAILNRSALALAADSVVTISTETASKKYDSAEKIFELCKRQPIGMMIYNAADFMNAPIDVLVRVFRSERAKDRGDFQTMKAVWDEFEAFLMSLPRDADDESDHFHFHALEIIKSVERTVRRLHFAALRQGQPADFRTLALPEIQTLSNVFAAERIAGFMESVTSAEFSARFHESVTRVVELVFSAQIASDDVVTNAFTDLMYNVIRSTDRSEGFTGFVVAGYGSEDYYPSIFSIECDGVYFGQLRKLSGGHARIIDRRKNTSEIVPFAQSDMPERFIYGVDADFERSIMEIADRVLDLLVQEKADDFATPIGAELIAAMRTGFERGIVRLKEDSRETVKSMVDVMSKRELAELAYHLVELVSRKRRFSDQEETVGGPIDVAVITRNEGFVWFRRKHYFGREENPGYFLRAFGKVGGEP